MAQFEILSIEFKATAEGKKYLRVQAKPGGWCSIWEAASMALVKEHGTVTYEGELVKNGDFTNVEGLKLAVNPTPVAPSGTGVPKGEYHAAIETVRMSALNAALQFWSAANILNPQRPKEAHPITTLAATFTWFETWILYGYPAKESAPQQKEVATRSEPEDDPNEPDLPF